jgi:hypothetical protein
VREGAGQSAAIRASTLASVSDGVSLADQTPGPRNAVRRALVQPGVEVVPCASLIAADSHHRGDPRRAAARVPRRCLASPIPAAGMESDRPDSSPVNDGAAAVMISSTETARRLGLRPRARLHSFAVTGDDPLLMLTGIIPATRKVLDRAGLRLADIDAFEVNEAFASVVLAWLAETGANSAKVNINGGATAIGHPLGASGARLMTTLLSVLEQTGGRYGLQTMCEAGGLANATFIQRL